MHVESTLDPPVLIMRRAFAAPRDLVFKAWTEPDRLKRWFGPKGWELTFCELDLRPGGEWRYAVLSMGVEQGMSETFDRLDALLAEG